jgi:hypothetical protein
MGLGESFDFTHATYERIKVNGNRKTTTKMTIGGQLSLRKYEVLMLIHPI